MKPRITGACQLRRVRSPIAGWCGIVGLCERPRDPRDVGTCRIGEESPAVRVRPRVCESVREDVLDEGASLVGSVHGRLRLLLAGFVGGGRAAVRAIADAGYDVLAGPPKPTRGGLLYAAATTLRRGT